MKNIGLLILFLTGVPAVLYSQEFELDRLGKEKWVKYQGSLGASGWWSEGSGNRDRLGYVLRGDLQFTLGGLYHLPLSFTYSDQQFRAPNPIRLNRFSLRPSYKGIRLLLGDGAMSFMPYTLNGHQFTGVGLEIDRLGGWLFSAMYGRLLKAVGYSADHPENSPVLERMGYGFQGGFKAEKWQLRSSVLFARDEVPLLGPEELKYYPFPEVNRAWGLQGGISLFGRSELLFDLAESHLQLDGKELSRYDVSIPKDSIDTRKDSNKVFHAIKVQLQHPVFNGKLGVVYERIDPGYRTFGAYYFNADLENVHIAATQKLFKDKMSLSLRSGVQRDNLDRANNKEFKQFTHAIELSVTPLEGVSLRSSYSNFQSYTNTRDQFDYINTTDEPELLDTLQYRQLSEQASLSVNYHFPEQQGRSRALGMQFNYQGNRDSGGAALAGGQEFYQGNMNYHSTNPKSPLTYGMSLHTSFNRQSTGSRFIIGPGVEITGQFLSKKLRSRLGLSYNYSREDAGVSEGIFNSRANASWRITSGQSVTLSGIYQLRGRAAASGGEVTLQLQYRYAFDNFRLHFTKSAPGASKGVNLPEHVSFRYRQVAYSGTIPEVNRQIALVRGEVLFSGLPPQASQRLGRLKGQYLAQTQRGSYKFYALQYLAALYRYSDLLADYHTLADRVVRKIMHDMKKVDFELERRYARSHQLLMEAQHSGMAELAPDDLEKYVFNYRESGRRLKAHRWLQQQMVAYRGMGPENSLPPFLQTFLDKGLHQYFQMLEQGKRPEDLMGAMELELIDHAYQWSLNQIKNTAVVLRYHDINSGKP